ALVVHRRNESLSSDEHRQFVLGAQELTPLIVDLRMIATTRNAATTDALTGLANRGAIVERLNKMLETGTIASGSVLLLDIDHFKRVNDSVGHAAGDEVLRRIAKIISASVREIDVAGRIGGEEFLVVMAGATRDIALTVGERLRLAVSLSGLRHADGDPITVSIGAASASAGDTPDTLLARSDLALYEAKNAGRNRLVENLAVS
ncbi:MAG: GGDEF domain-containing protein, partial [Vulcanimicrobiaceae bacterium]